MSKELKLILSVTLILIFSGCTTAPAKKAIELKYITGDGLGTIKYEAIKKQLTRSDSQYAFWRVTAYPFTKPLLEANEIEKGIKNADSKEKVDAEIKSSLATFNEKDTCFSLTIETSSSIESAQLKNWRAKYVDGDNKQHELAFIAGNDVPNYYTGGSMDNMQWFNSGIACVGKKVDLTKSFSLFVIPQLNLDYGQAKKAELSWIAPIEVNKK